MFRWMGFWVLMLVPTAVWGQVGGITEEERSKLKEELAASTSKGLAYLLKHQESIGLWKAPTLKRADSAEQLDEFGVNALIGLAIYYEKRVGLDNNFTGILRYLKSQVGKPNFTNTNSICMTLKLIQLQHHPAPRKEILALGEKLLKGQTKIGLWLEDCPPEGHADKEYGDMGYTQVAVEGLWIAKAFGLNIDQAMKGVEKRLRESFADKGWKKMYPSPSESKNVTEALSGGMLGLAFSRHLNFPRTPSGNQEVDTLAYRKSLLQDETFKVLIPELRQFMKAESSGTTPRPLQFWSTSKVCWFCGCWSKLDDWNWYPEMARNLMKHQHPDGGFSSPGNEPNVVDTAYALLFLFRAPEYDMPDRAGSSFDKR